MAPSTDAAARSGPPRGASTSEADFGPGRPSGPAVPPPSSASSTRRGPGWRAASLREALLAAALLLIAFALRAWRLGDADIWWDEGLAVWAVRKGLWGATVWTAADVHPPLFFWSLWAWRHLVGESEWALRALIALQGLVLAALAYALAKAAMRAAPGAAGRGVTDGPRAVARRAGLFALALAAASPFLVWWSQELRMYMLAAVFAAAACYAILRWVAELAGRGSVGGASLEAGRGDAGVRAPGEGPAASRPGRAERRWLAAYVAGGAATLLTVYLAGAALLAINLPILWQALRRRLPRGATRDWALAQLAVLALFLPWFLWAGDRMSSWQSVRQGVPLRFAAELWTTLLATGVSVALGDVRGWTLAFLALVAVGVGLAWWGARSTGRLPLAILTAFLFVPLLFVWAATQPRSLFYSPAIEARYFLPFALPVYALVGLGFARAGRRAGTALALLTLALLVAFLPRHYEPRRRTGQLPAMANAIWSQAEPGDAVLLVSGNRYPLFLYHYEREWGQPLGAPDYEHPPSGPVARADMPPVIPFPDRGSGTLAEHEGWQARVDELLETHPRLWLAEYGRDLQDPADELEAYLAERRTLVLSEGYGPDALHLFAEDGEAPTVTALSSRWPHMRYVEDVYDTLGLPGRWLPLVFLPATRLAAGEALELGLFARDAAEAPEAAAVLRAGRGRYSSPVPVATGPFAAVPGAPPDAPVRLRLVVPVDERTPGGPLRIVARWREGVYPWTGLPARIGDAAPLAYEGADTRSGRLGPMAVETWLTLPDGARPGGEILVDAVWSPPRGPSGILDVPEPAPRAFAQLLGPTNPATGGPVWDEHDGPASGGPWSREDVLHDRRILRIPEEAPAGAYRVILGLYDPETGRRYPAQGAPSSTGEPVPADVLVLGDLELP